jgi:hypothetical protein
LKRIEQLEQKIEEQQQQISELQEEVQGGAPPPEEVTQPGEKPRDDWRTDLTVTSARVGCRSYLDDVVAKEVETYKKAGYEAVSRQVRITAERIRRALEVVFPIDPEAFFGADTRWTAESLPAAAR